MLSLHHCVRASGDKLFALEQRHLRGADALVGLGRRAGAFGCCFPCLLPQPFK